MVKFALGLIVAIGVVFAQAGWSGELQAAEDRKINVRLFGKQTLKGYEGCYLALWQSNRSPDKDKFAYVLFVRFFDAHPAPALVRIGKNVLELDKADTGLNNSTILDKVQLFRSPDNSTKALLEMIDTARADNLTRINKAQLTFIQRGKLPFVMSVKGRAGCDDKKDQSDAAQAQVAPAPKPVKSQAAKTQAKPARRRLNLDPAAVRLDRGIEFNSLREVPGPVRKLVEDNSAACDNKNTTGSGVRYAISDAMTLWQMPCAIYASSASAVFVTALNGTPYANLVELPGRPGEQTNEPRYDILNPVVDYKRALVSAYDVNSRGTCGTVEHFQLIVVEGEAVEFKLLEQRKKPDCAGREMDPDNFPLTYRAK